MKKITIVIDGPAGSGKSTVAKLLAQKLGYIYLDTGALYRTISWGALHQKLKPKNTKELYHFCLKSRISFIEVNGIQRVYLNNRDITRFIRTPKISLLASQYSALPLVRRALLAHQRLLGQEGGIVAEGRDLGTVVFPKADVKFFLEASLSERAKRRYLDLKLKEKMHLNSVKKEIQKRDNQDRQRRAAPLKKARDAVELDTTGLSVDEVVSQMYKKCQPFLK